MDEMDLANRKLDELKDNGYKSIYQEQRQDRYRRAMQEYEFKLNCPLD